MSDWSLLRNSQCAADDTTVNPYVATLTSGSANVKGAWVQVEASLDYSIAGVILEYKAPSTANYGLIDIGIGAGGSEVVVIPNINGLLSQADTGSTAMFFPLALPAGTRVACRFQSATGSATIGVKLQFISDEFAGIQPVQRWADWGTVLASSSGTTVVAGGSAHTKGGYSQLVAATAFTSKWLMIMMTWSDPNRNFVVDISVGAAAAEQIIIPDLFTFDGSGWSVLIPFSVPEGSRISARCASQNGSSGTIISILGGQ